MSATQRTALVLFVGAFLAFIFPLAYDLIHKPFFTWAAGQDVTAATFIPMAVLQRGDFLLADYQTFFREFWHSPYFMAEVNGQIVSRYPIAAGVLAIPFYGIPIASGWVFQPHRDWLTFPWSVFFPAKFAAAFISSLTVVMFFFCARALTTLRTSALITVVFALATSMWTTPAQGLWQHTPSILFQLIALWFLLSGKHRDARAVAPGAFFLSAATISRQSVGITALLFTIYVWLAYRPALVRWMIWAIPPALLAITYNTIYNGSPLIFGYQEGVAGVMHLPSIESIAGLLISPSRGLLVYSPMLIFALVGFKHWGANRLFYFFVALTFGIGTLLLSLFEAWHGGWGYGTRLMTDLLPYITLLVIPAYDQLGPLMRSTFWVMVAYSIILQAIGLWDAGARWHWHWNNYDADFWSIADNEPLFYLKEHWAMAQHFFQVYVWH